MRPSRRDDLPDYSWAQSIPNRPRAKSASISSGSCNTDPETSQHAGRQADGCTTRQANMWARLGTLGLHSDNLHGHRFETYFELRHMCKDDGGRASVHACIAEDLRHQVLRRDLLRPRGLGRMEEVARAAAEPGAGGPAHTNRPPPEAQETARARPGIPTSQANSLREGLRRHPLCQG